VALGDRSTWPIEQTTSLLTYLPAETVVWLIEPAEIQEQAKSYFDRLSDARGIYPPSAVLKNNPESGVGGDSSVWCAG